MINKLCRHCEYISGYGYRCVKQDLFMDELKYSCKDCKAYCFHNAKLVMTNGKLSIEVNNGNC